MNEVFADVVESETSPITTVSEHTRNVKIIQEVPLP
jgi:hypothetical protein